MRLMLHDVADFVDMLLSHSYVATGTDENKQWS